MAGPRQTAFEDDVGVGQAHRRGAGEGLLARARPCLHHEDRGEPVAVTGMERTRDQFEPLHRLGIERAGHAEEPIRVVHLDAVHDREVLVGASAAHGHAALDLVDSGHPGQHLDGAEDVLGRACHRHDVEGPHLERGREVRAGIRACLHVDGLPEPGADDDVPIGRVLRDEAVGREQLVEHSAGGARDGRRVHLHLRGHEAGADIEGQPLFLQQAQRFGQRLAGDDSRRARRLLAGSREREQEGQPQHGQRQQPSSYAPASRIRGCARERRRAGARIR